MIQSIKYSFIYCTILFSNSFLKAQASLDTTIIKKQLELVYERDQKTRSKGDSTQFIHFIDSCNLAYVESLIAQYGWLGKSVIGAQGNYTLWLVIQHADLPIQEKYYPFLQKSVELGESPESNLALLEDRILMRKGQPQNYGSQVIFNNKGEPEFYPIKDEKNVNKRRLKVGLEPIEKYAEHFGITYKAPE